MATARTILRTVLVMTILLVAGYVLRPVAWEIEAQLHDAKELLYRRVSGHRTKKQGVELPLATDENGLRLDVLEKVGSEEMAKQEQTAKKGIAGQGTLAEDERSKGQAGQQPRKVTAGDLLTQFLDQKGEATGGDSTLFGRLTRRGAWRGIVEPYLGRKPMNRTNAKGERTTTADVDSSDEGAAEKVRGADEKPGVEFGKLEWGGDKGKERRADAETGILKAENQDDGADWLKGLIGYDGDGEGSADGESEEPDSGGQLLDGVRAKKKAGKTGLDTRAGDAGAAGAHTDAGVSVEESVSGVGKEGVKTFLAVNADLTSGEGGDRAVTGDSGSGGSVSGAGKKPKPREVAEEEEGLESDVLEWGGESDDERGSREESGVDLEEDGGSVLSEERPARRSASAENETVSLGEALGRVQNNLESFRNGFEFLSNSSHLLRNSSSSVSNRSASVYNKTASEGEGSRRVQNNSESLNNGSMSSINSSEILGNISVSVYNTSASFYKSSESSFNSSDLLRNSNSSVSVYNSSSSTRNESSSSNTSLALLDDPPSDTNLTAKSWPLIGEMKQEIWEEPPVGVRLPAREEFTLRWEMVEHRAVKNTIVVTFANFAFLDFTTNWVRHLTDLGVTNILVGAMDEEILEALFFAGIPVFDMKSEMSPGDAGWGSPVFHKMGRERLYLVDALLGFGVELLMCDTDMVFLRDPLEYVSRFPQADVLTSSDHLVHTVNDESLEKWQEAGSAYNIGIIHYRPTAAARSFAREWLDVATKDDLVWDQNAFNDIIRRQLGPSTEDDNGLVYAYDGTLKLGILPVSLFCSGHTYFVQKVYKTTKLAPFAIHTTFQYSGTEGKRHRLREAREFYDEPKYYDPEGGLLAYGFDIPTELLSGGEHTVESHFALVNYQLVQLRNAFALAQILNRTLVLPELWCRFDRLWYPHNGVLEGTATPQPFLCPADHVLEIHKMVHSLPMEDFGEDIRFREYSLLDNPRLPAEVLASKVDVFVCKGGDAACKETEVKRGVDKTKWVVLERDPADSQVKALLEPYRNTKLIMFSTMSGAFGRFEDEILGERFRARVKQYAGIWCCIHAHPGHIYYDMYWDEKPGWKPKPPKDPSEDHPPLRLH